MLTSAKRLALYFFYYLYFFIYLIYSYYFVSYHFINSGFGTRIIFYALISQL
jgi:hypothetical protein